jgi:hypothetical protein
MVRSRPILVAGLLLSLTPVSGCGPSLDKTSPRAGGKLAVTSVDRSTIRPDAEGYIPWEDAKRLILSGEVTSVTQTRARVVGLTLKDGATYKAREDQLDEVWTFIKDHRLQSKISYVTE